MQHRRVLFCAIVVILVAANGAGQASDPEFMPLDAAKPAIGKLAAQSTGLNSATTRQEWLEWLQKSDGQIRARLDAGEEDSLTNLLRFGVTFTKEYRIDDEYLARYGQSSLVNAFAENRADDLVQALAAPNQNQGFAEMRAFVEEKGFSLNSAAGRKKLKAYLLANLARMREDFVQAQRENKSHPNQAFEDRGISLDSNLWPDYDLDLALRTLLQQEVLGPGAISRVAIVGPGLDFVNKQQGVDYYPPQTTQPFAVLDSLLRLGLARPDNVEVYTLDISPRVNLHIQMAKTKAASGQAYTIQLPWYSQGRWTDEFRTNFTQYWRALGAQVGDPVAPIPVPQQSSGFETRAIKVRPQFVGRLQPVDMNIIFQRLPLEPNRRFDLVIGTNIFIYYAAFEQSLAGANIAAMLKPGGLLLSNQELESLTPAGLEQLAVIDIPMTSEPVITDHIYCYRLLP